MNVARRCMALAFVVLSGCPSADIRSRDGGADAAIRDAGVPDAGPVDAGGLDSGPGDAGPGDAGPGDAGSGDAAAPDAGPPIVANVVFVTSTTTVPGSFGGLAGADAICNERAMRGGLPGVGTYVAWLSTTTSNAMSRLRSSRGWVRPDGSPFADSPDDLAAGRIWESPSMDEMGAISIRRVVTGTNGSGTLQGTACRDWTSTDGDAWAGLSADGTRNWTSDGDEPCSRAAPIYCFGTGRIVSVLPREHFGRLVFLSRARLAGDVGRGAFDAACESEASDAGYPRRRFSALVSTSTEPAIERLTEGAPWVRPDGVVVAETLAHISSQVLLAPITPSADELDYRDHVAWVGSTSPELRSGRGEDCAGWTSPSGTGHRGSVGSAIEFFSGSNDGCATLHSVLCFER